MRLHTDEQCKIKVEAVKSLLGQIMRSTKEVEFNSYILAESAVQLCDELLREFPTDDNVSYTE